MSRRVLQIGLAVLVIVRSAVFVFWPQSHFDSDQAITGLMAKHLSELRAFPVFWYGQTYMLGVESWLAAPVMAVLGATVTALKLPLLAINVAIALLLFRVFTRDGAAERAAAFATLFFALAAPITSAHFLTANGGNVEPLLYVLLIWTLRDRPIWMGLVLGIGFLNREFTIYGAVALLAVDAVNHRLLTAPRIRRYAVAFATAAAVWVLFLGLRRISSAAGPGTTMADLSDRLAGNNVLQVMGRLCFDVRAIASGSVQLFTVHLPELFGLERQPLTDFGIESTRSQGLAWSGWLLLPALGIPIVRTLSRGSAAADHADSLAADDAESFAADHADHAESLAADHADHADSLRRGSACLYLTIVAALSLAGYLVGRCGLIDFNTMRYELLSVPGAAAIAAWYLTVERSRILRRVWAVSCAAIFSLSAVAHAQLLGEYLAHPPVALKQELVRALDARQIRYGYADFWVAYYVDFMSRERILLAPEDIVKIRTYNRIIDAHRSEAVRISRRPCPGGEQLTSAFWECRP